jgi:WD40 repeat protein
MAAIFISYAHSDAEIAKKIKTWLDSKQYEQVFLDVDPKSGIPIGDDWQQILYEKLSRCHVIILVLTPRWCESTWCFVELAYARALGKIILPVLFEPIKDQQVLPEIQAKILPDFKAGEIRDWNEALSDIEERLRSITSELARGFNFDKKRSPYPGIQSFESEDAAIFFGRDQETIAVIERLEARRLQGGTRFLVVVGASGSGKSSLLKAGVLPQLLRRRKTWVVLPLMRPEKAPIEALAKSIAQHLGRSGDWEEWNKKLTDPAKAMEHFAKLLKDIRVGDAASATVLLPIDQLEELFKVCPENERIAFLRLLADMLDRKNNLPIMALATGRSDVLERLSADVLDPLLKAKKSDDGVDDEDDDDSGNRDLARIYETYVLAPMPLSRIKDLVEGPAGVAAINFEPKLAQHIASDVKGLDALPLLALTLSLLYQNCASKKMMTIADYDLLGDAAAKLSPIENSVRRVVTSALDGVTPPATMAEMSALRDAFVPHMVRLQTESGEPLRQSARKSELPPESIRLINALRDARLLVEREVDTQERGEPDIIIEVSHEALFKSWKDLEQWLNEDRGFLLDLERIRQLYDIWAQAADEGGGAVPLAKSWPARLLNRLRAAWGLATKGGKADALLHGLLLSRAHNWLQTYPRRFQGPAMTPIREFIEASVAAEEAERQSKEKSLRILLRGVSLVAVIFLMLSVLSFTAFFIATSLSNETQIAESRFLARDARAAVANGDDSLGLLLALVALPADIDHPNRPFVKEAEYALQEAIANHRNVSIVDKRNGAIWSAVYSNDGTLVATVSDDNVVRVKKVATDEIVAELRHDAPVSAAAFSLDGTKIATASHDRIARIWAIAQGNKPLELRGHEGMLTAIAYSPDGKYVLTASADGTSRLWDSVSGTPVRRFESQGHKNVVWGAAFSPNGERVVTASWDETVIWTTQDGKRVSAIHTPPNQKDNWVLGVRYSPDGKHIVTAGIDNTARIWDAETGGQIAVLSGHEDWVNSAAFSPDSRLVVTASSDKTIRLWSATAGAPISILSGHDGAVYSAVFSPDGKSILSSSEDHTARIWSANAAALTTVLQPGGRWVNAAAFSPDGTRVLTGQKFGDDKNPEGEARLWDLTHPGESRVLMLDGKPRGKEIRSVAYSPDGTLVVTASDDNKARLFDAKSLELLAEMPHEGGVWFAAFSKDSKYIVTASGDRKTRLWKAGDKTPWLTLSGHTALVSSADFSRNGKRLVTASWDQTVLIWDVGNPTPVHKLEGPRFTSAVFSPDGKRVATASDDGLVRIWNADNGKPISTYGGHTDALYSVAYSDDGKFLLTASKDRTARIWDAQTGAEVIVLRGHNEDVRFAAFSRDGKSVVTASSDGTARVWKMPLRCEELLKYAMAAKTRTLTANEKKQYFQNETRGSWAPMLAGKGEHCH